MKNLIISLSVLFLFLASNDLSAQREINTTKSDKATKAVKVDVYEKTTACKPGCSKTCCAKSKSSCKPGCSKTCCAKSKAKCSSKCSKACCAKSKSQEKANVKSRSSCKPGCAKTCKHKN